MYQSARRGLTFRLKREARIEGHLSYTDTGEAVQDATVALQGIHPTEEWEHAGVDVDGKYFLKKPRSWHVQPFSLRGARRVDGSR